jgi:hypothetical protein
VRETFGVNSQPEVYSYRADWHNGVKHVNKWRPSIFMPREASRITLEIVSVRVERLQAISGRDAIAEGIEAFVMDLEGSTVTTFRDYLTGEMNRAARNSYQTLWQSMNGLESWAGNPFVWVIEFKTL